MSFLARHHLYFLLIKFYNLFRTRINYLFFLFNVLKYNYNIELGALMFFASVRNYMIAGSRDQVSFSL